MSSEDEIRNLYILISEGEFNKKEEIRHRAKINRANKKIKEKQEEELKILYKTMSNKEKLDIRSQRYGFTSRAQKQRYDRWCKKNGIIISIKNQDYMSAIKIWIKYFDKQ